MISANFKVDRSLHRLLKPKSSIRIAARNSINQEAARARREMAARLSDAQRIPADDLLRRQVFFYPANDQTLKGYMVVLAYPKRGTFDLPAPTLQAPVPLEQYVDSLIRPMEEAIERSILGRIIRFIESN